MFRTTAVLLCLVAVPVATAVAAEPPTRAEFIRAHYTKHEHRIEMRDGARLFTVVYAPNDAWAAWNDRLS